jgi:hypothetical protein
MIIFTLRMLVELESMAKSEMEILGRLERTEAGQDLGIRASRRDPAAQLAMPTFEGRDNNLSSLNSRRSCAKMAPRSASDHESQTSPNEMPCMRSMTITAWFL